MFVLEIFRSLVTSLHSSFPPTGANAGVKENRMPAAGEHYLAHIVGF